MNDNNVNVNYQKVLDDTLKSVKALESTPKLLIHGCCAPCSSYVLEYLSNYFEITLLFYNPNIMTVTEYDKRASEVDRLINSMDFKNPVNLVVIPYDDSVFYEAVKGYEDCPEGKERCFICYELRMREAAEYAKDKGYDYFTTTLTISPLKNSSKINEIGKKLSDEYGISYLYSDFKKKNGFKRSVELSKEYSLYRQDYCGCVYSKR